MTKRFLGRIAQALGLARGPAEQDETAALETASGQSVSHLDDELLAQAAQLTGIPCYEGYVQHAYAMDSVATTRKCPRCHGATEQYYANWIYASQIAPRLAMAPAGYFCQKCPTVIVDENMVRIAVQKGFEYRGLLGLHCKGREEPQLLKTWNGEPAVYILDEHGMAIGLSTLGPPASRSRRASKSRPKRRKRASKQAGKKKRRRKKR